MVLFGLGWCIVSTITHWQVLHAIGLMHQNLEYSHYFYQGTAGFYAALTPLLFCGKRGIRRAVGRALLIGIIASFILISHSYCRTFRRAFHVAHEILRQFNEMELSLPQDSNVFFMDVPTHIEGARVWWGGTSINVWRNPAPSLKPVFEKGLFHFTLEPLVRQRYPYKIYMLSRDLEVEKRRNEYESPPSFSLDYLRTMKLGEKDYFLQWLPEKTRLVDVTARAREAAKRRSTKKALAWDAVDLKKGSPWKPFGDARWEGLFGRRKAAKLSSSGCGGLSLEECNVPTAGFANLVLEIKIIKPGELNAELFYKTEEDDRFDANKRVTVLLEASPDFRTYHIPLTRRIHDLLDGDITGIRLVFRGKGPAEVEIRSIRIE